MPPRNLQSSLKRRPCRRPMADYDALPKELRHWLTQARLPWSPRSVAKVWSRALTRCRGDIAAAIVVLDHVEARNIARDAHKVWGAGHPACSDAG